MDQTDFLSKYSRDRATLVTLADSSTTKSQYNIVSHDGEPMLQTTVTDALGRHVESYTDEKDRNRETVQHAGSVDHYNAAGQIDGLSSNKLGRESVRTKNMPVVNEVSPLRPPSAMPDALST